MIKTEPQRFIFLSFLLILLTLSLSGPGLARDIQETPPKPLEAKETHPRLQNVLQQLALERNQGQSQAQVFARDKNLEMAEDRITVIIEPQANKKSDSINLNKLESLGAAIEASSRSLLRATVPVKDLTNISNQVEGVGFVRLPKRPHTSVVKGITTETIDKTGATSYHDTGFKGQGTKVAVIDIGFNGLTEAMQSGELPENVIASRQDFTETGLETGSSHGTAVTEIVHDMAPEAELFLKKIGDSLDLENARDSAVEEGVDIINHSVAWLNNSYYDGTGPISDIASDAQGGGILWVNSAGNYALKHWQGDFSGNESEWHDFGEEDKCNDLIGVNPGDTVQVYMTWNDWPETDQDYDLYLINEHDEVVTSSAFPQDGNQRPTEMIRYTAPLTAETPYCISMRNYNAPNDPEIDVFSIHHQLQYSVEEKSLIDPAVDEKVLAVGAIDKSNWLNGPQEPFSSQGPTNGGVIKPDVMGPDGVSTFSLGGFYGTSASSPIVSGAASLLLSRESQDADSLQNYLESSVEDMGPSGKDNVYGSGKLYLSQENCKTFSTPLPEGWNLFSPPGVPQNPDPETALGDDLDSPVLFRWEPATGKYIGGKASSSNLSLKAGAAYWLYAREDNVEVDMNVCIPSSTSINLSEPGWQMVGSPYSTGWGDVTVNGTRIQEEINQGSYSGPLEPYFFPYEEEENKYLVSKSENWNDFELTKWDGYWIKTTDPHVELGFEETDSAGTERSSWNPVNLNNLQETRLEELASPPAPPPEPRGKSALKAVVSPTLVKGSEKVTFTVETEKRIEVLRVKILETDGETVWDRQTRGPNLAWKPEGISNGIYLYEVSAMVNGEFKKAGIGKLLVLK